VEVGDGVDREEGEAEDTDEAEKEEGDLRLTGSSLLCIGFP